MIIFYHIAILNYSQMTRHETRNFTQSHGVVVSFENAVYNNGVFSNFTAWTEMNKKYGTSNITYIIRHVELLGHDTYESQSDSAS